MGSKRGKKESVKKTEQKVKNYSGLSQEEIVALYESESINNKSYLKNILEKQKENLRKKEKEFADLELIYNDTLYIEASMELQMLQEKIRRLEIELEEREGKDNEENFIDKFEELKDLEDVVCKTLEKEIQILREKEEEEKEKLAKKGEQSQKDTLIKINELEPEIKKMREEIEELELKNNDKVRLLYKSTGNINPYTRKFPSIELRNTIVSGTLAIAKYWAKKYYILGERKVPIADLFQIAYEALISAAHYYIPNEKAKFSTYAKKCITNQLSTAIWHPKRMKKRPYKINQFFEKEEDYIKYIQMYIGALKVHVDGGRRYTESGYSFYQKTKDIYTQNQSPTAILYKVNIGVINFNKDKLLRDKPNRILKKIHGPYNEEKLMVLIKRFLIIIKHGKMNVLLTDEDRNIISSLISLNGAYKENERLLQLRYYLDWYQQKLNDIKRFLETEKKLESQSDGFAPTDKEILDEINKQISEGNKKKYHLKKENFFTPDNRPYFKHTQDYYHQYKKTYHVDFFIPDEDYNYSDNGINYISRKEEKEKVLDNYLDCYADDCDELIDRIKESESSKIELTKSYFDYDFEDERIEFYDDFIEYEDDEIPNNVEIITKEEAIERIKKQKDLYDTEEKYLNVILNKRRDKVKAMLKETNDPIFEYNKGIAPLIDLYKSGPLLERHIKPERLSTTKKDIEQLFANDDEMMILIAGNKSRYQKFVYKELEEEALDNVFLGDYYLALKELEELERNVMLLWFDKNGDHSLNAHEIAVRLNTTDKKVYQAKDKALTLLRRNPKLQSYNE